MATQKQIEANRRNALRSTGPRTAEGKASVSQNASKHGFFKRSFLAPGDVDGDYETLVGNLEQELAPVTTLELSLVRQIANAEWRLNRAIDLETGLLGHRLDSTRSLRLIPPDQPLTGLEKNKLLGSMLVHDARDSDTLSKLSRYEMRLSRRYFAALTHLQAVQDRRRASSRKLTKKKVTKQSQ